MRSRFGALRLRLAPGEAAFEFVPVTGPPLDSGTLECRTHAPSPARHRIARPRDGVRYPRLRTMRGRVSNARSIELRLVRRGRGRGCEAWDGRRLRRASCRTSRSFPVEGRGTWRWRHPGRRGLPPGGYRLTAVAESIDGSVGTRTVRLRVGPRQ